MPGADWPGPHHSIVRVLYWLKRHPVAHRQRTWFMVDPNPRERNYPQYEIRFGSGSTSTNDKIDKKFHFNDIILAWNRGRRRVYNPDPASFTYPHRSSFAIVNHRDVHLTNPVPPRYPVGTPMDLCPPGLTAVRRALIGVLDAFPKYDLETDEGIEQAIGDMTRKLGRATTVEEFYHLPMAWEDPSELPEEYDPSKHEADRERIPGFKLVEP
ncbi:hypothetical protein EWM64_g8037 [Hericium alpestre]|uniref:Uncharacterized protein n=1 Tax=Hericium alpestre TaxID=135208 RepID=A0A4Y9ZMY4_9AGAM|nr:hypothetical protein EWM64_g8037 [Hericium alpestre]